MAGIGQESGLAASERLGVDPAVVKGHTHQGHGLAFAGSDEHVHLTARVDGRHLTGQAQQVVGLLAHGRNHEYYLVTAPYGASHVVSHLAHAPSIRD